MTDIIGSTDEHEQNGGQDEMDLLHLVAGVVLPAVRCSLAWAVYVVLFSAATAVVTLIATYPNVAHHLPISCILPRACRTSHEKYSPQQQSTSSSPLLSVMASPSPLYRRVVQTLSIYHHCESPLSIYVRASILNSYRR